MAQRANRKSRVGVVTSDARDKTVKVAIQRSTRHRRYDKIVRTSRVLHAHDEQNDARIGDRVLVEETRPVSKTKRWRVVEIVERAR